MSEKKASPFDFSSSASASIENEILSGKFDPSGLSSYVFLRTFVGHTDTVLLADEINAHPNIPARYAYHSMHSLIQPKRKRFSKWIKPSERIPKEVETKISQLLEVGSEDVRFIINDLVSRGMLDELLETVSDERKKKK